MSCSVGGERWPTLHCCCSRRVHCPRWQSCCGARPHPDTSLEQAFWWKRAGIRYGTAGGYCCAHGRRRGRRWLRADEIRLDGSYTNVRLTPGEDPTLLPNPSVPPPPNGSAMRRVLRRARDGVALNVDEAAVAMTARGEDLADLCVSAGRVRDAGLESAGRRGPGGG